MACRRRRSEAPSPKGVCGWREAVELFCLVSLVAALSSLTVPLQDVPSIKSVSTLKEFITAAMVLCNFPEYERVFVAVTRA